MKQQNRQNVSFVRALARFLLLPILLVQSACGTLLYPERRGQTEGRIDPAVAIMNGIGVLFFNIPGLVAFAVDFSTGAIYLPPDETSDERGGRVIEMDPDNITPETLAAVIREHTGKEVTFTREDMRVLRANGSESIEEGLSGISRAN